nr:nucleotidyltransferase substrate binding protein [uncultured Niameybacter sp.]
MNLEKAYHRLMEACNVYNGKDDMIRDSVIQRFEFSYELSHKVLCEFLKYQGVTLPNTFPRTIYKKAYVNGLLEDEKVWLQLLEDRNATSHIYSEKLADEIAGRICTMYVQAIGKLVTTLKELI